MSSPEASVPHPNFVYHSFGVLTIVSIIITISQLIHIAIFYRKHHQDQNLKIYILLAIRLTATILISILFLFLKSNYFFTIEHSQYLYTKSVLSSTHYANTILIQISQSTLFLLFVYRIQIVFKDTIYEYPKSVLSSLYIGIFIAYIITSILSWFAYDPTQFVVYRLGNANNLYISSRESTKINPIGLASAASFVLYQMTFNIICLYMFTKRLIRLKKSLIEQYAMEITRITSGSISSPSLSTATPSSEETYSKTMRITEIRRRRKKGNAADRILKLKEMIKRHTILVWITVGCATTFFILWSAVSGYLNVLQPTLLTVINVNVWLMFGCCDEYWKFATKKLCCYVCYIDGDYVIGNEKGNENENTSKVEMTRNASDIVESNLSSCKKDADVDKANGSHQDQSDESEEEVP